MKKILFPAVALAAFAAVACSDTPAPTAIAPDGANYQLVGGTGTTVADANIKVFSTFSYSLQGGSIDTYDGPGITEEGNELGTCLKGGRWLNPRNKPTGPMVHPHCIRGAGSAPGGLVVLEEIDAFVGNHPTNGNIEWIYFDENSQRGDAPAGLFVEWHAANNTNSGYGMMVAYGAVDGVRTGMFVIDLSTLHYANERDKGQLADWNMLNGKCFIGEEGEEEDPTKSRSCLRLQNGEGDDVLDENGVTYGRIAANYFSDVTADIERDAPTATVYGYLYWETID